ncbi:MAG: zinc metallopeptidase [Saprospiraceae bacterium]|nr:zinc metallopeptidase [Saprospiraceae bacterium]
MGYFLIAGILTVVGMVVSNRLKSKFSHYSKVPLSNGMSGKEVAETMLRHYGITDVKVLPAQGFLSDHYNPANKTVNLSPEVYNGRSVAAAAVASHECGHAVQHATAYSMLRFRSAMVPVVKFASMAQQYLFIGAFLFLNQFPALMTFTLITFVITTAFSFVTLPVEFDASNRALKWLNQSNVASGSEHEGAKDALWWAAMTYVSAALSSLVILLYLFFASRD